MKRLLPALILALIPNCYAQEPTPAAKPLEHVRGTVMATDPANHTVTVREDGASATLHVVDLKTTKTLVKVAPTAKNLDGATRITADDLAVGDRVDVRGSKAETNPAAIIARSVVLMSGRELQQVHQAEANAWQRSTGGVVSSIDGAAQKLAVTARTPEGPKSLIIDAGAAQFTRYSPETPKLPKQSSFAEIQAGDQVKVIGEKNDDGTVIKAQKVYSGTFKSVAGTLISAAPDGKSMVVKDLATKQPVTVLLSGDAAIRKLPPMMAYGLARRFNPDFKAPEAMPGSDGSAAGAPGAGAPPPAMGAKSGEANLQSGSPAANGAQGPLPESWNRRAGQGSGGQGPGGPEGGAPGAGRPGGGMRGGSGDLGQVLERAPVITLSDLKPGDAVVISGSPSAANKSSLLAANVIAGVEPIFQSASPRQAQSLGDWGNSLGGGAMDMAGGQP